MLQAIDNQVARQMQRTPEEREEQGVQKAEPLQSRMEKLVEFILQEFGEQSIGLDGILVASEAFPKALRMIVEELGEDGLGEMRSRYCRKVFEAIERDVLRTVQEIGSPGEELN